MTRPGSAPRERVWRWRLVLRVDILSREDSNISSYLICIWTVVFHRQALTREFEREVFGARGSDKPQLPLEVIIMPYNGETQYNSVYTSFC